MDELVCIVQGALFRLRSFANYPRLMNYYPMSYLWKGALVEPHVGCSRLLQRPSIRRYLPGRHSTCENTGGHTSRIKVLDVSINGKPFSISSYVSPYLKLDVFVLLLLFAEAHIINCSKIYFTCFYVLSTYV